MDAVLWYAPTSAFFGLFILLGVFLLLFGLLSGLGSFRQGQLGETIGTVAATDVAKQTNADNETFYEAVVKYCYWVSGYSYEGERILATCHQEKNAQAKLEAYRSGQKVSIVYDLNNHHLSRLQNAKNQTDASTLVRVGLIFVVGGYGLGRGMTIGFWPDSWQNTLAVARSTGTTWGIAAALLLASCLHSWGTTVPVSLTSKGAIALFQQDPVLFAIWRSSTFRWLNGFLAGLYLALAIALILWHWR